MNKQLKSELTSGGFADRETIDEAFKYAFDLLKSAGIEKENELAIFTSLYVLMNTIGKQVQTADVGISVGSELKELLGKDGLSVDAILEPLRSLSIEFQKETPSLGYIQSKHEAIITWMQHAVEPKFISRKTELENAKAKIKELKAEILAM